jgi:hypothetical protein
MQRWLKKQKKKIGGSFFLVEDYCDLLDIVSDGML